MTELSLNFAAFARLMHSPATRFERLLGADRGGSATRASSIESLYRFNAKFFPRWQPRYLLYEGGRSAARGPAWRRCGRSDSCPSRAFAPRPEPLAGQAAGWQDGLMDLAASDVGSGPRAVVLLHGQPGSGADLGALADALAPQMRVIVPDRPGYGRSGGQAVGFEENARRVVGLLDGLGVARATLAGHSWGAGVALAAARLAPERVDALALISPVTPGGRLGLVDRVLANPLLGPPLLRAGFGLVGRSLSLRPVRRLAAAALPGLRYEDVLATAAQWRTAPVRRSFFTEQRALVEELPALSPALASIDVPATVVTGTRDRFASRGTRRSWPIRCRGARWWRWRGPATCCPSNAPA